MRGSISGPPKTPKPSIRIAGSPTTPIEGYSAYLETHLQPVIPLFERLKRLEEEDAIRTDGKAAPLTKSRHSISFSIGELEELLTPESWDERLDEWLKRELENA
jgi:hypothetical protein